MFPRRIFSLAAWASLVLSPNATAQLSPGEVVRFRKISQANTVFPGGLDVLDQCGRAAISPGDIDGDGTADLAVGAIGDDDGGTAGLDSDTGAVWIHFLYPNGDVRDTVKISATSGGLTGEFTNRDQLGRSLGRLGDLDRDGVPDIAVGAARDDDGGNSRGAIYILFLRRDGTVKSQQKISSVSGGFGGELDDLDEFGRSIASLGDLDGDGVAEIAVGATGDDDGGADWKGAVWVLFLRSDGTVKSEQKISMESGGFQGALGGGDLFGFAADRLGDLDGDGVPELAIGAPKDDDGGPKKGCIWILFMKPDGTVKGFSKISDVGDSFGLQPGDEFGSAVAGIGDLDGDGVVDMAVGAILDDAGGHGLDEQGAVWIVFLNADGSVKGKQRINGLEGNFTPELANGDWFGSAVGYLGDLDGDGQGDIAAGARFDDDGDANCGSVWLLYLQGAANVPPVPAFELAPASGPVPLTVAFSDRSSAGAQQWSWDFGDGTVSTLRDPSHTYETAGDYAVSLTVSGPGGSATTSATVEVFPFASASVRNGSGVNRLCYQSTTPPALGTVWTAEVDVNAHPLASSTLIIGRSLPSAGVFVGTGELLVSGARLFQSSAVPQGGVGLHGNAIPVAPALAGLTVFTQAVILGGQLELCNAVDLVLGY